MRLSTKQMKSTTTEEAKKKKRYVRTHELKLIFRTAGVETVAGR